LPERKYESAMPLGPFPGMFSDIEHIDKEDETDTYDDKILAMNIFI
jgi:hypothetical protein